jgi:ceroid-lipofuscinosis neuronal protein 5
MIKTCSLLLCALALVATVGAEKVIIPYERVASRPPNNQYCQAKFKFCPNQSAFPDVLPTDSIEVWSMKAPIWEFQYGDMMAKINGYHDAVGFKNTRTGLNYTMEWYELDQLMNCTFPHLVPDGSGQLEPMWCNQGAACFYNGIDDIHWSQNGSLVNVATVTGDQFTQVAKWVQDDNNTGVYYVSTAVVDRWIDDAAARIFHMQSYDCASFVIRVFDFLSSLGVSFDQAIPPPKYDFMTLFAENVTEVDFDAERDAIVKFYSTFTPPPANKLQLAEAVAKAIVEDMAVLHNWYTYYNSKYYRLHLKFPYFSLKYAEVPLPSTNSSRA